MLRIAKKTPTKTLKQSVWETADSLPGSQESGEYEQVLLRLERLNIISSCVAKHGRDFERKLKADCTPVASDLPALYCNLLKVEAFKFAHGHFNLVAESETE